MRDIEQWKPVRGYEGLYEASSFGRVRSLPRLTTSGKILKQYVSKRNGYCYISLCKNNISKTKRVHKLVFEAFTNDVCDGYDKYKTINHIDGNKTNNALLNLERVSQSENQRHAVQHGLQKKDGIKVICLDTLRVYDDLTSAVKFIGGNQGEMIARVCRGERSHYRNHHYAFYRDYIEGTIPEYKGKHKKKASENLWR